MTSLQEPGSLYFAAYRVSPFSQGVLNEASFQEVLPFHQFVRSQVDWLWTDAEWTTLVLPVRHLDIALFASRVWWITGLEHGYSLAWWQSVGNFPIKHQAMIYSSLAIDTKSCHNVSKTCQSGIEGRKEKTRTAEPGWITLEHTLTILTSHLQIMWIKSFNSLLICEYANFVKFNFSYVTALWVSR